MKILVGMPTRGLVSLGTVEFIAQQKTKLYCASSTISVCAARTKIAHYFLNSDYDKLLFLDDDVAPPIDVIESLLKVDAPIVSANYPIYVDGIIKSCACMLDRCEGLYSWDYFFADEVGIKEVDGCGLGCVLIDKSVFKKVGTEFKLHYSNGSILTGEDLDFCNRTRKAGFKILANFNVSCEHSKVVRLKTLFERYCLSKGVM